MNSNEVTGQGHSKVCAEVKLYTAKEALSRQTRRIDVPDNTELLLSPTDPEFVDFFSRVQLTSYGDLQLLGFVPRKLPEEKIRHAMTADDGEVYKIASSMPSSFTRNCDCGGADVAAARSGISGLRSTYNSIRKYHNPGLASLLSDHSGTYISWDSPAAGIIRNWIVYLQIKPEIIFVLVEDITINRNATLAVAPSAKSLLAFNIWIHHTGRLVQHGSYLKIWANSINEFKNFLSTTTTVTKNVPWLIT